MIDRDGSGTLELAEIKNLLDKGELHQLGLHPPEKGPKRSTRNEWIIFFRSSRHFTGPGH